MVYYIFWATLAGLVAGIICGAAYWAVGKLHLELLAIKAAITMAHEATDARAAVLEEQQRRIADVKERHGITDEDVQAIRKMWRERFLKRQAERALLTKAAK